MWAVGESPFARWRRDEKGNKRVTFSGDCPTNRDITKPKISTLQSDIHQRLCRITFLDSVFFYTSTVFTLAPSLFRSFSLILTSSHSFVRSLGPLLRRAIPIPSIIVQRFFRRFSQSLFNILIHQFYLLL